MVTPRGDHLRQILEESPVDGHPAAQMRAVSFFPSTISRIEKWKRVHPLSGGGPPNRECPPNSFSQSPLQPRLRKVRSKKPVAKAGAASRAHGTQPGVNSSTGFAFWRKPTVPRAGPLSLFTRRAQSTSTLLFSHAKSNPSTLFSRAVSRSGKLENSCHSWLSVEAASLPLCSVGMRVSATLTATSCGYSFVVPHSLAHVAGAKVSDRKITDRKMCHCPLSVSSCPQSSCLFLFQNLTVSPENRYGSAFHAERVLPNAAH